MRYTVQPLRDAGLHARWSKTTHGAPIILARDPRATLPHQREKWWVVSRDMWNAMQQDGIRQAFYTHTLIADVFSVPA